MDKTSTFLGIRSKSPAKKTATSQSRRRSGDFVWSDEFPLTIFDSGPESLDSGSPYCPRMRMGHARQVDVTVPLKAVFKMSYKYAPVEGKITV